MASGRSLWHVDQLIGLSGKKRTSLRLKIDSSRSRSERDRLGVISSGIYQRLGKSKLVLCVVSISITCVSVSSEKKKNRKIPTFYYIRCLHKNTEKCAAGSKQVAVSGVSCVYAASLKFPKHINLSAVEKDTNSTGMFAFVFCGRLQENAPDTNSCIDSDYASCVN